MLTYFRTDDFRLSCLTVALLPDGGKNEAAGAADAVQGLSGSVTYTAKLVKLGDVGTPTPFTAKKDK